MKSDFTNRRTILKSAVAGSVVASLGLFGSQRGQGAESESRSLEIAGYDYDRVRAIADGGVGIAGANVRFNVESIYAASQYAFGPEKKYEITEIGLMPFVQRYINDDYRSYSLIPVFISRIFRHRNIFVHADSGIEKPEDLRGRRVGTPGYGFSANTWIRGFLLDEYGVAAEDMQWIQTTASSDGGIVSLTSRAVMPSHSFQARM